MALQDIKDMEQQNIYKQLKNMDYAPFTEEVLRKILYKREEKVQNLDEIESLAEEILEKGQCVSLKELAVTGRDLIKMGMAPGKEIGEKLNELLCLVIEEPELNTKEELLKFLWKEK